jgi:hypothetical protein
MHVIAAASVGIRRSANAREKGEENSPNRKRRFSNDFAHG